MRRTPNIPFPLLAILALAPILGGARGCEEDVNVGGDPDGGVIDGGGTYDPCGGLSCGDSCTLCDPADSECVETAVDKMCQPDGSCSATVPECSAPYDPCGGLSCGDSCSLCDPADPECVETAVEKFCQFDGQCRSTSPECTPPYNPCAGLSCGESCTLCDPSDPECTETAVDKMCQPDGSCSATVAECAYEPCAGLSCGESCTLCDPSDPECTETAVEKMCQPDGSCSATVAECSSACGATARHTVRAEDVELEVDLLCDDLFLCLGAEDSADAVEAAAPEFSCSETDPSPCPGAYCVLRPSLIDAAELATICAADAASGGGFICAVYL